MPAYNGHAPLARRGECVLYPAKGQRRVTGAGRHAYWGVCRAYGLEQEQRFDGAFEDVRRRFDAWADGIPARMEIARPGRAQPHGAEAPGETEGEEAMEDVRAQGPERLPERLYALAYKRGTAVRYVMAFESDDEALDAAEVAGKALEVAGVDGEYTVDELSVRWGRDD